LKTLKFKIRKLNKQDFNKLKDFCHYSNNLYNYSLYICRKYFEETNKYLGYVNLEKEVKTNENYKLLPVQTSQQIIRMIDKNFRSFFALINKKKKGQHSDNIHKPNFKKKGVMNNLIFTFQNSFIKEGYIQLCSSKEYNKKLNVKQGHGNIKLPFTYKIDGNFKQLIIKPINNGQYFNCYLQYEENKIIKEEKDQNNYLSIDTGINNLCSCFNSSTGQAFIINGKALKSYNSFYNKKLSEYKSILKKVNNKNWSKKLERINQKRYWYIDNYFNQVVNYIIKYCTKNNINKIIIGYNETWKTKCNIGKINNRNFYNIPYSILKQKLENKCNGSNFIFIVHEESFTSKCDALALEEIKQHDEYLGTRVHRGLYQSSVGKMINADVNGAINIMRKAKVLNDELIKLQLIKGLIFNPVKINFNKTAK
jgi:IS605 OrfB family transposase